MAFLEESERQGLLRLSRETLQAAFSEDSRKPLVAYESNPENLKGEVMKHHPCFVTLRTRAGRLRGCIGSLVAFNPLYMNVFHMTRQAAFEDPRFRRVEAQEVPNLMIHIAVLGPSRPLQSLDDLEIGKHGLQVSYGAKRGVLLASVAVDFGFSKEKFLEETCVKAGLDPAKGKHYEVQYFDEVSFGEEG